MSKQATTQVNIPDHLTKRRKPTQNSGKECSKIDDTPYTQFSVEYYNLSTCAALSCNNNLLLVAVNLDHILLFQFYTLEGFFVTSFKIVVGRDVTSYVYCLDIRFTNEFILASFSSFWLVRISDYNIKYTNGLIRSDVIRSLLDSDKYGNFFAIEGYDTEYKIGIYSFDLEFLKMFDNDLLDYDIPISLCIKEDTMFVVTEIDEINDSRMTLHKLDLTNGKIMDAKKLNTDKLRRKIFLSVDDMCNIFITSENEHICVHYASGRNRYYSIEKFRGYECLFAYVSNCDSISALRYSSSIEMFNLAF